MGMGFIAFIKHFYTYEKNCEILRVCSIWYLFTFLGGGHIGFGILEFSIRRWFYMYRQTMNMPRGLNPPSVVL